MRATAFVVGEREISWQQVLDLTPTTSARPESEEQFRRDRDLISAADLMTWLEHWEVGLDELRSWLAVDPVSRWVDAVCSGELERCATRLASDAAAVIASGRKPPVVDQRLHERAAKAREVLRAKLPQSRVEAVTSAHALQWQVVDYDELMPEHEAVAAEISLLVRHDGLTLREAAAKAGCAVTSHRAEVSQIPRPLGPLLASAAPGEIVMPRQVAQLIRRRAARGVAERARDLLVEEQVLAAAVGAVVWSDR